MDLEVLSAEPLPCEVVTSDMWSPGVWLPLALCVHPAAPTCDAPQQPRRARGHFDLDLSLGVSPRPALSAWSRGAACSRADAPFPPWPLTGFPPEHPDFWRPRPRFGPSSHPLHAGTIRGLWRRGGSSSARACEQEPRKDWGHAELLEGESSRPPAPGPRAVPCPP